MLKTTRSFKELVLKLFRANNNKVISNNDKANKRVVNSSKKNKFGNLIYMLNIGACKNLSF